MAAVTEEIQIGELSLDGQQLEGWVTFESFKLPTSNQRRLGPPHPKGTVIPLALRPSRETSAEITLDGVIATIESLQRKDNSLTKHLARHGTILFRDLPIHNAEDFSNFTHAFGYKPHEIIGIVVDRPLLAPNVAPANEAPKEVLIYNHNESPQVPHAPEYVFFYGHRAPMQGGESPISSSLELFNRAQREIPEFIDELAEKGVLSRVTYKLQQQFAGGSTMRQAFGKEFQPGDDEETKRRKVEAQIARYGRGEYTTWEWSKDDDGQTQLVLTHRLPAIRTQPETNLPTLFTGLAAYWKRGQAKSGARRNDTQQLFGDGTPIPDKYLAHLTRITDEIRVLHRWEKGDVLVFDNIVAQHGREPWLGEQSDRVVMASLFDGAAVPGAYGFGDWAQVVQAAE
ncbi:Clavaminate synthase-like protein [Aspergillus japonicus CBS 114.51]|uniref:Clavaminate synthase-like protein n=1 Tax=Aspergillus japonicus CBS 114.51 TaxID=1448312 RepID=A0A8T8XEW7_ASPJA|nr:Clavaminate synthase-like protein [Aspergillus japonicus CBS 114.51]RAH86843.1 Clavaminate synthase-like protein [Aspergillus japonicus CBS 114.51]